MIIKNFPSENAERLFTMISFERKKNRGKNGKQNTYKNEMISKNKINRKKSKNKNNNRIFLNRLWLKMNKNISVLSVHLLIRQKKVKEEKNKKQ